MPVKKASVSFTDPAFDFAQSLVDRGEYPTISAAVSGELIRARDRREEYQRLLEAEILRRSELPDDQWIRGEGDNFFEKRFLERHSMKDDNQ